MAEEQAKIDFYEAIKKLTEIVQKNPYGIDSPESDYRIYTTITLTCEISLNVDVDNPGKFIVALDPMPHQGEFEADFAFYVHPDSVTPEEILNSLEIDAKSQQWEMNEE